MKEGLIIERRAYYWERGLLLREGLIIESEI